jgi:hypothetical protein
MIAPDQTARAIASAAAKLVGGDRAETHGDKEENFGKTAVLWNAWLAIRGGPQPIDAHDVGVLLMLAKLARTQGGRYNPDDYVDMAGYAACAGEVAATVRNNGSRNRTEGAKLTAGKGA